MRRPSAVAWLNSLVVTPDARGEIIGALRQRDDLPSTLPNCTHLYCFVRDRLKKTDREHKSAAVSLYAEYQAFCKQVLYGDDA